MKLKSQILSVVCNKDAVEKCIVYVCYMIIEDHQPQTTMIFQTETKNTPSKNSFHYGCRHTWKNIGINRFKKSCFFNVWNCTLLKYRFEL